VQVHREQTGDLYRSRLDNHVLPSLGDKPLAVIKRSTVQGFVKELERKGLAASTIEGNYGLVATIFRSAVEDERLPRTPCRGIALPERIERRIVPLPREQVLALPGEVRARYRAAVVLAYSTGLRQGEVFGMQVDRIDFLRRQVRIDAERGQLVDRKGGPRIGPPKTKASARVVPLPDVTLEALAEHMRSFPAIDKHADDCQRGRCAPGCLHGVIFTNNVGGPLRRSVFNAHVWHKAIEKLGLPAGTGFHELRHFYASVLIDGGESVKVVQKRLGHKDATETLNTYSHLWPESEERTRAIVDAALRVDAESAPEDSQVEEASESD
jgi:integrase